MRDGCSLELISQSSDSIDSWPGRGASAAAESAAPAAPSPPAVPQAHGQAAPEALLGQGSPTQRRPSPQSHSTRVKLRPKRREGGGNLAYSQAGLATYTDKLFKFRAGRWEDLLSDEVNRAVASRFAGRSVACVDRAGSGRYAIYIANYANGNLGPHALLEMDVAASDPARGIVVLTDVAAEAGVNKYTGGRGVAVGPILSASASDIFCDNENGPNFLFHNQGDGSFVDAAVSAGLDDPYQHGRGVALADFNRDGKVDIVYGNWNGPHRLYLQMSAGGRVRFRDIATPKFSMPSPVRTVLAADFDNDQELEVFFNNIAYRGSSANRLFRIIRREHSDPVIEELNPGDAMEPEGRGTGGAVTDFDGDGRLDLILSHGESMAQPLSVFRGSQGSREQLVGADSRSLNGLVVANPRGKNARGPWKPQWAERRHPAAPSPERGACTLSVALPGGGLWERLGSRLGLAKAGRDSAWDRRSHGSARGLAWPHQTLLSGLPGAKQLINPPVLTALSERRADAA
ncbi:Cartilage acidic protein 1 [Platysternon megacephalum]|uniref:Cartilage acidic protein 1 n=1 Tax=Platysternon megacephalum TaxID=55544 RepID=A0A4D9EA41_9SAUR|nr:Cartilage acidic protein 1 [Platysternon megacephalum]